MKKNLHEFAREAYLNYALYVILDRALPNIRDGLKPVQRRIIYAMSELGLKSTEKHKKSARTVGDVIGKYHPHGDSACYEAMVHMAQNFSCRYPLIDGQGNWGSIDEPKSFAAMRYTESRLSAYSQMLLQELQTVNFRENFDATLEEPEFLPARLPNVLLNGATGIAVGMATMILPHNLMEISSACQALLANKDLSDEELFALVPAPDFPTGGVLVSSANEIQQLYKTGQGTIRLRADYKIDGEKIIIQSLPYQVSGTKIQEQIAKQMNAKKLPLVEDFRDESDHENPVRLVLFLKNSRVDSAKIMAHLFATTDLEKRFSSQMNVIGLNGKPQVKSLRMILTEWLTFRYETVEKKLQQQCAEWRQRLEILVGLRTAFNHLNDFLHIINNVDEPAIELQTKYQLSEAQTTAILNLRLRQLARLEMAKILKEQFELQKQVIEAEKLLNHRELLLQHISREIAADSAHYHDIRRTKIAPASVTTAQTWGNNEPITVVISKMGWIRAAKGHNVDGKTLSYKTGDEFFLQIQTLSNQTLALLTQSGRLFNLNLQVLPSARGYGEPLSSFIQLDSPLVMVQPIISERLYLVVGDNAAGFICDAAALIAKNKNGKAFLNTEKAAFFLMIGEQTEIYTQTSLGRAAIIKLDEIPRLEKGRGTQIIGLNKALYRAGIRLDIVSFDFPENLDADNFRVPRGHKGQLLSKNRLL